jgi:hypothetical protein
VTLSLVVKVRPKALQQTPDREPQITRKPIFLPKMVDTKQKSARQKRAL